MINQTKKLAAVLGEIESNLPGEKNKSQKRVME